VKRLTLIGLLAALALGAAGCGAGQTSATTRQLHPGTPENPSASQGTTTRLQPSARTFVSIVTTRHPRAKATIDLFSVSTARQLRRITQLPTAMASPAATNSGQLFLTSAPGPRCTRITADGCARLAPDSCVNAVSTLSLARGSLKPAFTVAGSEQIGPAIPNPSGTEVALEMRPCIGPDGTTGLFVRDLRSGHTRAITRSQDRCDQYGPAAWNQAGTTLAFLLNRSLGKPLRITGGIACPSGPVFLAVAGATGSSKLKLLRPDRGCAFEEVGFDRLGVVTAEGCDRGQPKADGEERLGVAMLIQYDAQNRLLKRVRLRPGLQQALITTEPSTGNVLITENQLVTRTTRLNQLPMQRDWFWEFNGHKLRRIARYRASSDGTQPLGAVAW
jgi:hypothetical protein